MEIVEQGVETVVLQNAIRRLIRKIDKRLIPFIMLLELSSFSSQIIIGLRVSTFYIFDKTLKYF